MMSRSVLVKVPATVGNFAGAMHCAALALDATFNLKVSPRRDGRAGVRYFGENGERVPRDRTNLVVRAMEAALHLKGLEFTGADFEIYSTVPVGVGLGSSTASVLAGLIAADRLYSLGLNDKILLDLARIYESRLDNLLAEWHGGFVACAGEAYSHVIRRTFLPGDFILGVVNPEFEASGSDATGRKAADPPGQDVSLHRERARELAALFARPGGRGASVLEPAAALPRIRGPIHIRDIPAGQPGRARTERCRAAHHVSQLSLSGKANQLAGVVTSGQSGCRRVQTAGSALWRESV